MPDCFERFRFTWSDYEKVAVPILVAVSGGADSVALARLLHEIHSPTSQVTIAHFNHRWRGAESDADAQFVRDLAKQLQWTCEIGITESADRSEESAREERYRYLTQVAQKHGARYLAVAHTADDQVETILHRVLRGTGLHGLAGIPRQRVLSPAVTLVRPLLAFQRNELLEYLSQVGQSYRTDASNTDVQYTRNRIRTQLLPLLRREYNAQIDEAILRLGQISAQARRALAPEIENLTDRTVVFHADRVEITAAELACAPEFLIVEVLVGIWRQQNWPRQAMGYSQWRRLVALLESGNCETTLPAAVRASRKPAPVNAVAFALTHIDFKKKETAAR